MTRQQGAHPRIGAADVIPFVPISGIKLEQCALLARQAGLEIWRRYGVPVYFYEAAAARPDRANLEDVRRGQFEGLRDAVSKEAARRPDLGGPGLHPTAGACAVGARKFLVAYNIYFDSADVAIVRAIAREIRAASGGLKGVKAMGVLAHGRAQLSMNITDFTATPLSQVYRAVSSLALKHKAALLEGEVIGLIPEAACERESEWMRQLIRVRSADQGIGASTRGPACMAGRGIAGRARAWPACAETSGRYNNNNGLRAFIGFARGDEMAFLGLISTYWM